MFTHLLPVNTEFLGLLVTTSVNSTSPWFRFPVKTVSLKSFCTIKSAIKLFPDQFELAIAVEAVTLLRNLFPDQS